MTNEQFKQKISSFFKALFITVFICVSVLAFIWSPFFSYANEGDTFGIFVNLGFKKYEVLISESKEQQ